MSDNLNRYCAILRHLKQHYPAEPTGNLARHLTTLAALICGIIGSKKVHLPAIASKWPDKSKRDSRGKRFTRFLQNTSVTPENFFVPFAQALLESLPPGPLVLVMDGSQIGRGCMALMISVLYENKTKPGNPKPGNPKPGNPKPGNPKPGNPKPGNPKPGNPKPGNSRRVLPLCWQVVKAPKGHFAQEKHRELLTQAKALIPTGRTVIFLGDGEFDGADLLADVQAAGWHFVCRTAKNVRLAQEDWPEETFSLSELNLQPGDCVEFADVWFTAQGLGPVLVGAVWTQEQKEPLLLVTSLDFLCEARFWYKKRFSIETFFSDQKSRGFYLGHSHLSYATVI